MKRRNFLQRTGATALAASALPLGLKAQTPVEKEYYELREYQLKGSSAPGSLSQYLESALIPALNRNGASKVGVFEEVGMPQPTTLWMLIAYRDGANFMEMHNLLAADESYQEAASSFMEIQPGNAPYLRAESTLLEAFSGMPQLSVPPKRSELFELRIYESHNAAFHQRKVQMFDKGEIELFLKVGLNPVFFGACRVGKYAPQLTYMLHFKDMEERDANWKKFIDHPDWDAMKNKPEYVGTVSRISRRFLTRTPYSQL